MDGFRSLEELYMRVKPALRSKVKELKRIGIHYVHEEDIWNYLKNNLWCKKTNLTLGELVNDIMCTSNSDLEKYVQEKYANSKKIEEKSEQF
jgi:hypothetical protein